MKKTKHHYIPKFLLKNFSRKDQIYLFRHDQKKIFCSSITDSFTINNLNTLTNRDGIQDKNLIEDIYDKYFENVASVSIKKIINDLKNIPPLGKDFTTVDYLNLLRFCMISHYRSPYTAERAYHAAKVLTYSMTYLKYFIDFGTVNFPYELDIGKEIKFSFLNDFDKGTKLISDLKLTIYYHNQPDTFFVLPDQHVIISSPNNSKFADKELKMFFPISSNVVVCFERVNRNFYKGLCELDNMGVEEFNIFFLKNTYDVIGCEDENYLSSLIEKHKDKVIPLKKFDPNDDFEKEKQQIKLEIITKLALNPNKKDFKNRFITSVNRNHEFKILTKDEFMQIRKELSSIHSIDKRAHEI